jgi:hypothetical protein
VAWVFAISLARAQPNPEDRETARSLMQEGRDLREKGDLQGALARFQAADGIMRVPTTGFEVARTQVALHLLIEARDTISAIRKTPAKPTDPQPFTEARNRAEELDASLTQRIPALTVVVDGVAPGAATVTVDGVRVPAAAVGLPRRLNPGHHVISARAADAEGTQEVDLVEKELKEVHLTLAAGAPAPAPAESPVAPAPLPSAGGESAPSKSHSPTVITWMAAGVGGVGLLVGGITGILSISKTSSLSGECPMSKCTTDAARKDFDTAHTLATVSNVTFIAGGIGAAVAVGSIVLGHPATTGAIATPSMSGERRRAATDVRVTPWVGLAAAGIRGSF